MIWIDENNFVREDKNFLILKKWEISTSPNFWWKWKILLKWFEREKKIFLIDKKLVFLWLQIVQAFDENDVLRSYIYGYKKNDIEDIVSIFQLVGFENKIFYDKNLFLEKFLPIDQILSQLDNVDKIVSFLIGASILYGVVDENEGVINNLSINIPLIWATWNYVNNFLEKINLLNSFSYDAKIIPKKYWANLSIFIDDEEILESFKNFYNQNNLYKISKVAKQEILSKLKSKLEKYSNQQIFFILKIFKNG